MKLKLKAARVNAGFTLDSAAKALNISKPVLINWEHGKTYPQQKQIDHLYALYQMPKSMVLTDDQGIPIKSQESLKQAINEAKQRFKGEA